MATDPISIANIPYWPWLPMGTSNFGGDIQVFTVDTRSTAPIGCSFNYHGLCAINGGYNDFAPINNWGIANPYPYTIYPTFGYYC